MDIIKEGQEGRGLLIENDAGFIVPNNQISNVIVEGVAGIEDEFSLENPYLYCVLQKCDILNRNGRIYPKEVLKPEVEKYLDNIKNGSSAGETDHPEGEAVISIRNTSFRVVDCWWKGNTLMGKIFLPITRGYKENGIVSHHPADKLAHDILNGFQYGVSSRGTGNVKKVNGKLVVQKDFELICWDFVSSPSTVGSWVYKNERDTEKHVQLDHTDISETEKDNVFKKKIDYLKDFSNFMRK